MRINLTKAFTLAEVLITLAIIGVVSAITIPSVLNHGKWVQYRTGALKAMSTLNDAIILYRSEYGEPAQCAYWETNPYTSSGTCNATCKSYSDSGDCQGYVCKQTGEKIPGDYNGKTGSCKDLYAFILETLSITKYCSSNAYSNGCIPYYDGYDTMYKINNPNASDTDVNKATSESAGFRQSAILKNSAFITNDGIIYIPYSNFSMPLITVDVNGIQGPNRWGHDLITFKLYANLGEDPKVGCSTYLFDKGGKKCETLIYK